MSETEKLEIRCLEPIADDNMISVQDDRWLIWIANKQHGKTMICDTVHYITGRPVKNKKTRESGRHKLYEGEFDDETFALLEKRARERSVYL